MLSSLPRRRAAVITTSWPSHAGDPAGHFVAAEVQELLREGWDVTVLAPGLTPHEPTGCRVVSLGGEDLFRWPGALPRLREDPRRALSALRVMLRARTELARLAPLDRIVAHWLLPSAWPIVGGGLDARGNRWLGEGGEAELVAHGSDVRLLLRMPAPLRNHILTQLCGDRLHLRFVSRALRDDLLGARGLSEPLRRALQAHSSVRPAAIELPPLPSRLQARGQLGVRDTEWLIVIASRLVPDKRVDVALGAASLVPHARVVVLGSGPEQEALSAGFPGVEFPGQLPRPEALAWIRAADLVLSASRIEGAPTVIREARALGVPVVATPSGDLADWANGDPDLWLSGLGDPSAVDYSGSQLR